MPIINGQGRVAVRVTGSPSGGGSSSSYLLDTYGGAAAAYSLRKLSSTYSGSAIRVRRSSDNTEQNIGFDGSGNLDTTALTAFVGAGNGFVTTWYDQSGNALDVTQTTAANQPQIVSSGSVITATGIGAAKPTLLFDGSNDILQRTFLNFSDYTMFNVQLSNGGVAYQNGTSNGFGLNTISNGAQYSLYERTVADHNFGTRINVLRLISGVRVQSSSILNGYINNTQYTLSPSNIIAPSGTFYIGNIESLYLPFSGKQSELIFYSSNQTSNITGIQTNINSYYSIYPTDADAVAFVSAAGITDSTQMSAVNTLVTSLKSAGIWNKMKAIYPFVGGTATSHKFNLKDPSQYQITWSGGITHSSTGVLPNGTNGFGDTNYNLTTIVSTLTPQNNHISFYSRTDNSSGYDIYGVAAANQLGIICKYTNGRAYYIVDSTYSPNIANANGNGFYLGTANSSSTTKLFKNSSSIVNGSTSQTSFAGTVGNIKLFTGDGTYGSKECAFASIGNGLTDAEASAFYTAVQAFQTTLGRQVA